MLQYRTHLINHAEIVVACLVNSLCCTYIYFLYKFYLQKDLFILLFWGNLFENVDRDSLQYYLIENNRVENESGSFIALAHY